MSLYTDRDAVIIDVARSPMVRGKPGGPFSHLHAVELLSQVLKQLVDRTGVDPGVVDDVLIGCVTQVADQSGTPGRWAWLAAGYPDHVPAATIERKCGSGQQAIDFAAQSILAGANDVVVAGGVESMSRMRMGSNRLDGDPQGPGARMRYAPGLVPQGVSAELVASRWGLSREELDAYAARSHQRAAWTEDAGGLGREIVPITDDTGELLADRDLTIRRDTDEKVLSGLEPAFATPEFVARFPEIDWSITAGNASQITDGAGVALVTSGAFARQQGLRPRARMLAFGVAAADPIEMLTGPIPATQKALNRAGLSIGDLDHVEVNEAFAPVPLAWAKHFQTDPERINPRGGAIALGHPLGASGLRLFSSLLAGLEEQDGELGLQTMCEAGGMANATIVQRI